MRRLQTSDLRKTFHIYLPSPKAPSPKALEHILKLLGVHGSVSDFEALLAVLKNHQETVQQKHRRESTLWDILE